MLALLFLAGSAAALQVTSPVAGVQWTVGQPASINWITTPGDPANVQIQVQVNGQWHTIAQVPTSDGSFSFTPAASADAAQIRFMNGNDQVGRSPTFQIQNTEQASSSESKTLVPVVPTTSVEASASPAPSASATPATSEAPSQASAAPSAAESSESSASASAAPAPAASATSAEPSYSSSAAAPDSASAAPSASPSDSAQSSPASAPASDSAAPSDSATSAPSASQTEASSASQKGNTIVRPSDTTTAPGMVTSRRPFSSAVAAPSATAHSGSRQRSAGIFLLAAAGALALLA